LGYAKFKNKVCDYYKKHLGAKNKIESFKRTLDKIVTQELPKRDNERLFQIRDFINTSEVKLNLNYNNTMCYYSDEKNALKVGIVCPNWSNGWRNISKDEFVSDQINFLFHFISQYVYRSYQVNLIGAIALSIDRATDFRGNTLRYVYGAYVAEEINSFKKQLDDNLSILNLRTLGYLKLINALDPYVNKVIFYYVKFLELYELDFIEEALTAADNMVDVIFQSIKKRLKKPTQSRREMSSYVYDEIRCYCSTTKHSLDRLYLLRCRFTAHPSKSKWWDFHEIYDIEIEKIKDSIRKLLIAYLKYENENREVESAPVLWSSWFKEYCDIVYDAAWFHDIP
jgi:hypothetical protein